MSDRLVVPTPRVPDPPDDLDPRTGRADALRAVGDHTAARTLLLGVLIDRPDSVAALRLLSLSHAQTGDWPTCGQFAEAGLRIRPDLAVLHRLRSIALAASQRPAEARAAAEAAVGYDPRHAYGHLALVDALLATGTVECGVEALAAAARAARVADLDDSTRLRLAVARGAALRDLDLLDEARAEFASVLQAEPAHETALSHAAKAEQESWHIALAARHVGAMLAAAPGDRGTRRRARGLMRTWMGGVMLGAGLAMAVTAGARWLSAGPAGILISVAALAAYGWAVSASARRIGTRLPRLLRVAGREPMFLLGAVVTAGLVAAAAVAIADPGTVRRPGYWSVLTVGVILAINAVVLMIQLAASAWGRARRARHHMALLLRRGDVEPGPVDPYPVDTPAAGAVLLALDPQSETAARRQCAELAVAGVGAVVTTARRQADERLGRPGLAAAAGIELVSFPVTPGQPPAEPEVDALVEAVARRVRAGGRVAFGCVSGAERSALLAATVLVSLGLDPGTAWARVTAARGAPLGVSREQRAWLDAYASRHPVPAS